MTDLRSLALLRNDPEDAARLIDAAEKGDVDAQYAAGLIFAEGRGVPQSDAKSVYWLTRALEQGDEEAFVLLRVVLANITDENANEADRLLAEHREKNGTPPVANIDPRGPRVLH